MACKFVGMTTPEGYLYPCRMTDREEFDKIQNYKEVMVQVTNSRNPKFHNKAFSLMRLAFDAFEPVEVENDYTRKYGQPKKEFERFRADLTIMAGFYKPTYKIDGSFVLEPESLSFASMGEERFQEVYSAMVDVVLQKILTNYTRDDLEQVIEQMMNYI